MSNRVVDAFKRLLKMRASTFNKRPALCKRKSWRNSTVCRSRRVIISTIILLSMHKRYLSRDLCLARMNALGAPRDAWTAWQIAAGFMQCLDTHWGSKSPGGSLVAHN
jgi:hypothetical protein